jgi:hypothetical protein
MPSRAALMDVRQGVTALFRLKDAIGDVAGGVFIDGAGARL